jgi:hypothetical protein
VSSSSAPSSVQAALSASVNDLFEYLVGTDNLLSFEAAMVDSTIHGGVSLVAFLYFEFGVKNL